MLKPVIIILSIGLILYCIKSLMYTKGGEIKATIRTLALLAGGTGLLLVMTGKIHILGVLLAGLIPVVRTLAPWILRALPTLIQKYLQRAQQHTPNPQQPHSTQRATPANQMNKMSIDEAYDVLNLKPDATKDEVIQRHKELIQKNHPDKGGSDYLAAKINLAKDIIIQTLQ